MDKYAGASVNELLGDLGHELQQALAERHDDEKLYKRLTEASDLRDAIWRLLFAPGEKG